MILQGLSITCEAQGKYKIDGIIKGLTEGEIYVLGTDKTDTIKVSKGKFQIQGDLQDPVENIAIAKSSNRSNMDEKSYLLLFVEAAPMHLELDYEDFPKGKLKGSKTQDDAYKYNLIINEIQLKYKKELNQSQVIRKKYNDARAANKSEETLEAIKYQDNDAGNKLEPMYSEMDQARLRSLKDNSQSYYSLYLFRFSLAKLNYQQAESYYNSFNPLYKTSRLAAELAAEIQKMKKGIPGVAAGPINTLDINGTPIKLDDFKGKYVLIDLWASWCVPCRKGNPHLLKLYAQYKPKGLEILGVSEDDSDQNRWRKAVEKDQIGVWRHVLRGLQYKEGTYEQIHIDKDITQGYNIHVLPTKILVDPNGIIAARYDGGELDDKRMDEDLAAIFMAK